MCRWAQTCLVVVRGMGNEELRVSSGFGMKCGARMSG